MKLSAATLVVASSSWLSIQATAKNLGTDLSEGTGYLQEYPKLSGYGTPKGYDDTVAFLVGGNYVAPEAAEIEGKVVVLGDFIIGSKGTNSIGKVGVGSGIVPSFGTVFMQVGGNIDGGKTDGETWFPKGASVEYGGECISSPKNRRSGSNYPDEKACGSMFIPDQDDAGGSGNWLHTFRKKAIDMEHYLSVLDVLKTNSEYWYNLAANGVIYRNNEADWDQNFHFKAVDDNCLQVFHIDYNMLSVLRSQSWGEFIFDSNLKGKTILINVSPYDANGNLLNEVYLNGLSMFRDPDGGSNYDFSPAFKAAMLWNFYKTPKVVLGPKPNDNGSQVQFPGSVLVPSGDLDMHFVGQDGRLIVKGNLLHDKAGSEFHNYEFDPPCDLPLPPGGGGASGDPHIKRWNRKPFQFHGECDLMLIHSDHVNGDKTLDVHIRTTIVKYWSQIESAAMKVGNDIVQIDLDKIFVNGVQYSDDDLPIATEEFVVTEPIAEDNDRTYVITLTDHSTVSFKIVNEFMNVFVAGSEHDFGESVGLMGDFYRGKPYNRKGERMYDLEEFAFEWQVNHEVDPILFQEQREPQLPANKCRMPTEVKAPRKLRGQMVDYEFSKAAYRACENKSEPEACLSDVFNTGSLDLSKVW